MCRLLSCWGGHVENGYGVFQRHVQNINHIDNTAHDASWACNRCSSQLHCGRFPSAQHSKHLAEQSVDQKPILKVISIKNNHLPLINRSSDKLRTVDIDIVLPCRCVSVIITTGIPVFLNSFYKCSSNFDRNHVFLSLSLLPQFQ